MDELELVCQEAARNLAGRGPRPLPATIVLPLAAATRVTSLPDWPDDDDGRAHLVDRFAADVARPANAPCYGFLAEGVVEVEGAPVDVVVVTFGARGQHPRVTAAPLTSDGVGEFAAAEPLDPAAFPFLVPLQRAVDAATPPDAFGGSASG
jgi:hypothetical protein